jgi:hypothetical protein
MVIIGIIVGLIGAAVGIVVGLVGGLVGMVLGLLGGFLGLAVHPLPVLLIAAGIIWLVKESSSRNVVGVQPNHVRIPPSHSPSKPR